MGVSHSMNAEQVDQVLTQFEKTTGAIKSIETKIDRVEGYARTATESREHLTWQTESAGGILDGMTESMNTTSDDALEFLTQTLDRFAALIEMLETTFLDLKLESAPKELQRELGPLLMPAVVLVIIVTVSNCFFGFLIASDPELAQSLTPTTVLSGREIEEGTDDINILNVFAILHVILIGIAILYLVHEFIRRRLLARRRRREAKEHHRAHEKQLESEHVRDGDDSDAAESTTSRDGAAEEMGVADEPQLQWNSRGESRTPLPDEGVAQTPQTFSNPMPLILPAAAQASSEPPFSDHPSRPDGSTRSRGSRSSLGSSGSEAPAAARRSPPRHPTPASNAVSPTSGAPSNDNEVPAVGRSFSDRERDSRGKSPLSGRTRGPADSNTGVVGQMTQISTMLRSLGEKTGEMVEKRRHQEKGTESTSPSKMLKDKIRSLGRSNAEEGAAPTPRGHLEDHVGYPRLDNIR